MGETLETHIVKGIGLTAHWGSLIRENNFDPEFSIGLFDNITTKVHRFLPNTDDFSPDNEELNDLVDVVAVDEQFIPGIQAVSGFYDIDPVIAISMGMHLRGKVLASWEKGFRLAYAPDGKCWTVYSYSVDQWELC